MVAGDLLESGCNLGMGLLVGTMLSSRRPAVCVQHKQEKKKLLLFSVGDNLLTAASLTDPDKDSPVYHPMNGITEKSFL